MFVQFKLLISRPQFILYRWKSPSQRNRGFIVRYSVRFCANFSDWLWYIHILQSYENDGCKILGIEGFVIRWQQVAGLTAALLNSVPSTGLRKAKVFSNFSIDPRIISDLTAPSTTTSPSLPLCYWPLPLSSVYNDTIRLCRLATRQLFFRTCRRLKN